MAIIRRSASFGDPIMMAGPEYYEPFSNLKNLLSVSELAPAPRPFNFPQGAAFIPPDTYEHEGTTRNLAKLLEDTRTAALLVLKNGEIAYENYWLTGGRATQWISMSVCKSWTSALMGIALGEGLIDDLADPVDKYLPWLSVGGYAGVSIIDILRMSSGTDFTEKYQDMGPDSDIAGLTKAWATGAGRDFVATRPRRWKPGAFCQYNSCDPQVIGYLVQAVTGKSLTQYMQEKICDPLGFEYSGYWLVDAADEEIAAGGLNLTARDYAKLGELYRNGGVWNGRQIVPADYVRDSVTIAGPQFAPGKPVIGNNSFPLGYGYQWWIPDAENGEFTALGVYNQYIYVNPSKGAVVVKLSANPRYGASTSDEDNKDIENISVMRAIVAAV